MLVLALLTSANAGVVRHALIVGSNDGGSDMEPLQYATQDAERIRLVLTELGGFSSENITVLGEPGRDELLAALQDHAIIASDNEEDMFLFYYSGHATARGLKLGEETLPYEELRGSMNGLSSEVRLGVLDACRSGEITRLKGLTLSEPFATDDALSAEGEAWLTASAYNEDAQESDTLQGSFFTHYLVSGLRGAADKDDGVVSLGEAYDYAYDQTSSRTGRTDAGAQHPAYNYRMQGAGDLALTDVRQATARITIPEDIAGVVTILSFPDETPLVEVAKKRDVITTIALPPGDYMLRLKDASGTSEIERLHLDEGSNLNLPNFTEREAVAASRKGIDEVGVDASDIAPVEDFPPPLLYDPDAPRLLRDHEGALEAFRDRAEAHASYKSRRLSEWLNKQIPGASTHVGPMLPPRYESPETAIIGDYRYTGVCDTVGIDCLHVAVAAEQLNGLATITFTDGALAAEGPLTEGIPSGEWVFYYANGQPHSTGMFSNGITYGEWTWWYSDGQKRMRGELQGEAKAGTWQEWYDSGKRKSRTEYTNGALDGRRVEWYPSGQKRSEGRMIGERKDGDWVSYFEEGRKQSRGAYDERGRTGTWTTWSSNGVKASRGRYVDDLKHGDWTYWWEDGIVSAEGSYQHGSKVGKWEAWHSNAMQRSIARYSDGMLSGRYQEWDDQGSAVKKGRYRAGEPIGRWSQWEDGIRQTERVVPSAPTTDAP
ncbi:MAG: antitoxin component YwqK of YwqJK toxin-antitoxin module [Myxococcota bacterium]|jgi:antitoxin component YwqK of YwqJK toxin-antitoxin module